MAGSVIVGGARTPFGRLLGNLKALSAPQLGSAAIAGALERSGTPSDAVELVIMGQVLTAGSGQLPARQAAIAAGVPWSVPAISTNKVCLSGLDAVATADVLIRAGEQEVVVAGGQESMTQAPHLLPGSRAGFKFGDVPLVDHMQYDGLTDVFTKQSMGAFTDQVNAEPPGARWEPVSRADQDAFAAASHQRAAKAWKDGLFANEVVPVEVPGRNGAGASAAGGRGTVTVAEDEGFRPDATAESLGALRPAFDKNGAITAGNSSPLSDGAAALVVMSEAKAAALGLKPLAKILAQASVAGPDSTLQLQPSDAIAKACAKAGIAPTELDLVEINEAFAAVGVASARALGLDSERINVNGGAIALGHPLGASGARILLHLALELSRRGGGIGAAALCGGGGQGIAVLIQV
ncbi:acetyl-CoA C-acetyltransferase [Segniliparus rugosus]|uniref:Probable acetyl-CoA acetyltransferase n=1 Tax=Segniliparus rugosus (strain ATCC BAA-974 / DSM 45345 / CCUG 50838 / CIP 108380 / JCM 13579 / CDC 945) TaxID=679197 RepID=U1LMV3_SEGRC|nr:acetyl-CoA C-acetyltransferase [Segniliparus rugosus]ERG69281.1 acetyl-CoA C-acetyltransferase [Segniliparus rugosus ATCC BAA-974]